MAFIPGGAPIDVQPLIDATLTVSETPITTASKIATKIIGTSATLVNAGVTDLADRKSVTMQNNGRNAMYVSNANTVSKATGLYIAPGATVTLNVAPTTPTPLYAIAIGAPVSASIMEV